jgi:hypothetical protein
MGRYRKGEKELGVGLSYCIAVGDRSQNESIASSEFYNQMRCQSVLVFLWELQGRARYPSRRSVKQRWLYWTSLIATTTGILGRVRMEAKPARLEASASTRN